MATHDQAVRAVFHQADELITVHEGPELFVRAANPAALELMGGAEVLDLPASEVFGDRASARVVDLMVEVQRTGRSRSLDGGPVRLPGARGKAVERRYAFRVSPWRDDSGEIHGVVTRGREVTPRPQPAESAEQRAESALAVVRTLQDVLLPEDLPVLPGLHVDSSYLLAAEPTAAGGDWYDAVVRPSGAVVLVAGDAVGHGPAASAVMGQLRAVLHNRLLDDVSLADAVEATDRHACLRHASRTATLVAVEIDPETGELSYITAGHPSPLVVGVEGETRFLPPSGAGPLGSGSRFAAATGRLTQGEMVLLYTDGAVERPERGSADATDELAAIVAGTYLEDDRSPGAAREWSSRTTERVCRTGLELLARRTGHRDDITLLAAQRTPTLAPLSLRMPAEPRAVSQCRLELGAWLEETGTRTLDAIALQHAVGELVDNAVRHAYGDALAAGLDTTAIRLDATLLPTGEAEVVVVDRGSWQPPSPTAGRGLAMARGFMDSMEVDRGEDGTRVTVRHHLTRPAALHTAPDAVPRHGETRFGVDIDVAEVAVRGDVDARSVDELRVTLDRATLGRTTPVTLDLSAVTHLGSPGVQLLFELLRDAPDVDLVAREGSVADRVLDVVRLGHST